MQWKEKDKYRWRKWFAWRPVWLDDERLTVWLEVIYIRKVEGTSVWVGRTKRYFIETILQNRTNDNRTGVSP